jgi:hypothetical protein
VPATTSVAFFAFPLDIWHRRFGYANHAAMKKFGRKENAVIANSSQKILLIPSLMKDVL